MAAAAPVSAAKPTGEDKYSEILPNRKDEPDFKLRMLSNLVMFVCGKDRKPVYFDMTIRNPLKDRHTFKVKCTSAEIFRVQPPFGFINAGESVTIRLWFQNKAFPVDKDLLIHYFVFYHMKATDTKLKEKELWSNHTGKLKPDGVRRLGVIFSEKK